MAKYIRRINTINAIQWRGVNYREMKEFVGDDYVVNVDGVTRELRILSAIRNLRVPVGDYVIENDGGGHWVFSKSRFEAHYQLATDVIDKLNDPGDDHQMPLLFEPIIAPDDAAQMPLPFTGIKTRLSNSSNDDDDDAA